MGLVKSPVGLLILNYEYFVLPVSLDLENKGVGGGDKKDKDRESLWSFIM